jgi:2,3,4,5-tetrahydropyridine-2,6-dicarboxylate N-succinyltransferase
VDAGVRVVPGGSAIRDGCYLGRGVVCMPPMYVNVGAYVDEETMIDSHALVGSCARWANGSISRRERSWEEYWSRSAHCR